MLFLATKIDRVNKRLLQSITYKISNENLQKINLIKKRETQASLLIVLSTNPNYLFKKSFLKLLVVT
jgi:hypothetical protein